MFSVRCTTEDVPAPVCCGVHAVHSSLAVKFCVLQPCSHIGSLQDGSARFQDSKSQWSTCLARLDIRRSKFKVTVTLGLPRYVDCSSPSVA